MAIPCGILGALIKLAADEEGKIYRDPLTINTLRESNSWTAFSGLIGFLIVFRTQEAYSRFWNGCTATHKMRTLWFSAGGNILAYCRTSSAPREQVWKFQGMFIRLLSMLHAAALAEIEEINVDEPHTTIKAFKFNLIDPEGIDEASLRYIKACDSKVELLLVWIQNLLVETNRDKILEIPPPVMSRILQVIELGMSAFHDAVRLTQIPFPFPYAQTCDVLLVLHWIVTPMVTPQWVETVFWTGFFVTLQVFILWALNAIASEIENPFGSDANDLDGECMQEEMNAHLLLLLDAAGCPVPRLRRAAPLLHENDTTLVMRSFKDIWEDIGPSNVVESGRKGQAPIPTSQVLLKTRPSVANGTAGDDAGTRRRSMRGYAPNGTQDLKDVRQGGLVLPTTTFSTL